MKTLTSFSIYALSTIVNSAVAFFLLPVFTHYLSPDEYGKLGIFTATISLLTPLVSLSAYGAIQAEYYKLKREDLGAYIYSALLNSTGIAAGVSLICWIFSAFLSQKLGLPVVWIISIPLIILLTSAAQIFLVLSQSENKPLQYSVFSLSQAFINIGLSVLFVVQLRWSWEGRAISLLITSLAFCLIALFFLVRAGYIRLHYSTAFQKDLYRFGLPLIPHATGAFILDFADRFLIKNLVNDHELGIYNVGYQIASILTFLDFAFIQVYTPVLYEYLSGRTNEQKQKLEKIVSIYILVFFLAVVGLGLTANFIIRFFLDKNYSASGQYVFWIGLGYFFVTLYKLFAGYVFYFKKTGFLLRLSVINIVIGIGVTYLLVKQYQTMGAAIATAICFLFNWLFIALYVRKNFRDLLFKLVK
jgi:O-antigen/teichoic acid export membrane protein